MVMKYLSMWKLIVLIFNLKYVEDLRPRSKELLHLQWSARWTWVGPFVVCLLYDLNILPAPIPCELCVITGIRVAPRCLIGVFFKTECCPSHLKNTTKNE